MNGIKRILPKSEFGRNVLTLMTGTGLAQILPVLITPILTRIYTPDDFGQFALYVAITSILGIVITGRYELAIIVPESDEDSINIVALSIGLSFITSTLLLIIVFISGPYIARMIGNENALRWMYLIPLSTLIMGSYQSLNYWNNRCSNYKKMATSRVLQGSAGNATQLVNGYISLGTLGLILGQLFGQIACLLYFVLSIFSEDKHQLKKVSKIKIYTMARKYVNFPKYLIVAHGFNISSSQAPVILINGLFTATYSGFYMLVDRVLSMPISLIASAVGDVFRQQASSEYAKTGQCKFVYLQTLKKLTIISILPFSIGFFYTENLFGWIFGEEWTVAGQYAKILIPMFFLRFITSPLSVMFMIAEAQRVDLLWQLALFALVVSSFFIANIYNNIQVALYLFSISYCLMYAVGLMLSYLLSCGWQPYNVNK